MEIVLWYVLGVVSVLLVLAAVRWLRAAPTGLTAGRRGRLTDLAEVVTELGEELAALPFDPAAPDVPPESLADYRRALDCYGGAGDALDTGDTGRVRRELASARNALVRLDARANGLPVPIDVSRAARDRGAPPAPPPSQSGRFGYSGSNRRHYTIPIDWPEPGRAAIIEMTRTGKGITAVESVHIDTSDPWEVEYRCQRRHRLTRCRFRTAGPRILGSAGGSLQRAPFCGHGLIVVKAADRATWSLSVTPERPGPEDRPLSALRKRLGI